jgi:hypothetical protein
MEGAQLERGLEAHKNTARGTTLLGGEFPVTDWEQHYKDVRNRLNGIKPKPKQIEIIIPPAEMLVLPEPEPEPEQQPTIYKFTREDMMLTQGLGRERVRLIVLPILKKHQMTWRQLIGQSRTRPHILLRREAWFALVSNGYGFAETGRICNRDHTSILHAVKQWKLEHGSEYQRYLINEGDNARLLCGAIDGIADVKAVM